MLFPYSVSEFEGGKDSRSRCSADYLNALWLYLVTTSLSLAVTHQTKHGCRVWVTPRQNNKGGDRHSNEPRDENSKRFPSSSSQKRQQQQQSIRVSWLTSAPAAVAGWTCFEPVRPEKPEQQRCFWLWVEKMTLILVQFNICKVLKAGCRLLLPDYVTVIYNTYIQCYR